MNEKNIIITTIDLKDDYEPIGVLYVIESSANGADEKKFNQALTIAQERLKKQCKQIGGDAVIGCTVTYAATSPLWGLISMSGTAVKLKSKQ